METYDQKKRRLLGNKCLHRYLNELNRLFNGKINKQNLLSIVDTDTFLQSVSYFKDSKPYYKNIIKFSDKNTLKNILSAKITNWDVPYMVYLSDSLKCGLLEIPSLSYFNLDFSFFDEPSGIIIFIRMDGKEKILLDYYEDNNDYFLEIEIYKVQIKD